jgi:hypothetical protein
MRTPEEAIAQLFEHHNNGVIPEDQWETTNKWILRAVDGEKSGLGAVITWAAWYDYIEASDAGKNRLKETLANIRKFVQNMHDEVNVEDVLREVELNMILNGEEE